jgi:hypothetical protein
MIRLADLRPTRKGHVFDLVQQAGFDVRDWMASSNDRRGPKANPKYCYLPERPAEVEAAEASPPIGGWYGCGWTRPGASWTAAG